jgi:hypothetical protein
MALFISGIVPHLSKSMSTDEINLEVARFLEYRKCGCGDPECSVIFRDNDEMLLGIPDFFNDDLESLEIEKKLKKKEDVPVNGEYLIDRYNKAVKNEKRSSLRCIVLLKLLGKYE